MIVGGHGIMIKLNSIVNLSPPDLGGNLRDDIQMTSSLRGREGVSQILT